MKYLGMEFESYDDLKEWSKKGHIEEYKRLARMFAERATMELNAIMCDRAEVLHDRFGMSWPEIEQLELEAIA